jgi:hypothetical protein
MPSADLPVAQDQVILLVPADDGKRQAESLRRRSGLIRMVNVETESAGRAAGPEEQVA